MRALYRKIETKADISDKKSPSKSILFGGFCVSFDAGNTAKIQTWNRDQDGKNKDRKTIEEAEQKRTVTDYGNPEQRNRPPAAGTAEDPRRPC